MKFIVAVTVICSWLAAICYAFNGDVSRALGFVLSALFIAALQGAIDDQDQPCGWSVACRMPVQFRPAHANILPIQMLPECHELIRFADLVGHRRDEEVDIVRLIELVGVFEFLNMDIWADRATKLIHISVGRYKQ